MPVHYRADVDGLRAIAVLGVVLYHVGGFGLTGGYVGVDVFFVISGYLITGIIAREIETGQFSFPQFYERRIRRLLPALTVVVLVTTIAAFLFLFPVDFKKYGRSLMHIAALNANRYFARNTGYFFDGTDDKPMLHTWSLAVEEQFYLVFPLLLWALFSWRRNQVVLILIALAGASILTSIDQTARAPERAFFSSTARVSELLLGAVCALTYLSRRWPRILREAAAVCGLILILVPYLVFSDETPFPGAFALVPCLGAALVIVAGQEGETVVGKILSFRPIVAIGLISYSVYLWHWPLLVFAQYRYAMAPSANLRLGTTFVVASLVLGYLSWRFVERPFRRPKGPGRQRIAFGGAVGVLMTIAAAGLVINGTNGLPDRWPSEVASAFNWEKVFSRCPKTDDLNGWPEGTCLLGNEGAKYDTLIWGDSHAGVLASRIVEGLKRTQRGAILVTHPGCPPLLGATFYGRGKKNDYCKAVAAKVVDKLAESDVQYVILAARWAFYAEGNRMPGEGGHQVRLSLNGADNHEVFDKLLKTTVAGLTALVDQTIVIGPVPEVDFLVGRAVARNIAWGQPLPPNTSRLAFERRQRHVLASLTAVEKQPKVRVIRPDQWLCNVHSCRHSSGGHALYVDTNHISGHGRQALEPMFTALFAALGPEPINTLRGSSSPAEPASDRSSRIH